MVYIMNQNTKCSNQRSNKYLNARTKWKDRSTSNTSMRLRKQTTKSVFITQKWEIFGFKSQGFLSERPRALWALLF